jgi:ankyrin repeat protein
MVLASSLAMFGCRPEQGAATKRLYEACEAKNLEGVKRAISEGADVNSPRRDPQFGFSPLEVSTNAPDIVAELLKQGAAPKKAGAQGYLPLAVAAVSGAAKSMELILKAGALLEGKDADGETALAQAIRNGRSDNAKLLISWGANVNSKDRRGQTPLFHVVMTSRLTSVDRTELAKLLISRGADTQAKDIHGRTPISYADTTEARATGVSQDLIDLFAKQSLGRTAPTSP